MKLYYSKMIMSGLVATSVFMVGCQKKGSSRLTPEVGVNDANKPGDELKTGTGRDIVRTAPASSDTTVAKGGSTLKTDDDDLSLDAPVNKDDVVLKSGLASTDSSKSSSSDSTKAVVKPIVLIGSPATVNVCPPQVIAAARKNNEIYSGLFEFSKKASLSRMAAQSSDATQTQKDEADADRRVVADYSALLISNCDTFVSAFNNAKSTTCNHLNGLPPITMETFDPYCMYAGITLKKFNNKENVWATRAQQYLDAKNKVKVELDQFKAKAYDLSNEAKALLSVGGLDFNMVLSEGIILPGNLALNNVQSNKVVCSLKMGADNNYSDTDSVSIKIGKQYTASKSEVPNELRAPKMTTFLVNVNAISAAGVRLTEDADLANGSLVCVNIDLDSVTAEILSKTFGEHLKDK